ncbi:MAG: hypothetical protein WD740_05555 [Anaerolineales bacterium]
MTWLIVASLAYLFSVASLKRSWELMALLGRMSFYLTLALWIWFEAGEQAFKGSETSLLGWFIIGLALFLAGDVINHLGGKLAALALVPIALAALAFALGFDIIQPDQYALVPGVLLAVLVASVAVRAFLQMTVGLKKQGKYRTRLGLGMYAAAMAVLVFAGVFKMVDRGWPLLWAYSAGGGALAFAAGQLWQGWERMLGKQTVPAWMQVGTVNLGQLMMVAGAMFVYKEFL